MEEEVEEEEEEGEEAEVAVDAKERKKGERRREGWTVRCGCVDGADASGSRPSQRWRAAFEPHRATAAMGEERRHWAEATDRGHGSRWVGAEDNEAVTGSPAEDVKEAMM